MSQSLLKKDFIMFQGLKSQVKSYAKRMIYSYRQAQSLKYFFDKTTQYMAIHKTLKPLPLEHKEAVLDYWSKFINMGGGNTQRLKLTLDWHTIIYNVNQSHPLDVRYLDNPFYYLNILPYFNPQNYASTFADKNYYDTLFPHHHKPKSIIKNIRGNFYQPHNNNPNVFIPIDKNSAIQLMKSYEKVVVKPTESDTTGSGKNVQILYTQQDEALIIQTLQDYKNDYIVQEFIQQHSYLSNLNESSVNTFRIMTLLYKGKIHTLPSSLLVGDTRPTSNGGFFRIGIDQSGNLRNFIIKGKGEAISSLPNVKGDFDVQIPHFSDVIDMAKSMHMCIPHIGLVGWDFSLDKVGNPIFIELNPMYPGSEIIELCNTPLFGDLSDEIFAEVTKKDQILKTVL